jgi:hypothetical protein
MLSVLDLFSRDHTTMTAEQIAESLALTAPPATATPAN